MWVIMKSGAYDGTKTPTGYLCEGKNCYNDDSWFSYILTSHFEATKGLFWDGPRYFEPRRNRAHRVNVQHVHIHGGSSVGSGFEPGNPPGEPNGESRPHHLATAAHDENRTSLKRRVLNFECASACDLQCLAEDGH
ncbi:hypothetical protein AVEN_237898-1 [Araneus ventricosus]|uniref:Uncharacterized protein n=1 Tax=Araneus ventricosus TaxID=182803 RepID=A0A4Y2U3F7_ARAVE|nr:hypothetical protein AVEN_237898-1 [Araneus ventricosus]